MEVHVSRLARGARLPRLALVLTALTAFAAACSASDDEPIGAPGGGSGQELAFHGELRPFDGVSMDTGPQPPAGPAQLRLTFHADGAVKVDAAALSGADHGAPRVMAKAGSGKHRVEGRIAADATLHIDAPPLKYDGPIPGIEALGVSFGADAAFDPFLVGGGSSKVAAQIPETKLPPIPLPGGIPGTLNLTITKGSVVRSEFRGTCASVDQGAAAYVGAVVVSGEIAIAAAIELKAPLSKTIDIPAFTVKIPETTRPIDLGTKPVDAKGAELPASGTFAANGPCTKGPDPKGPADGGSLDGGEGIDGSAPDGSPPTDGGVDGGDPCVSSNACATARNAGTLMGDSNSPAGTPPQLSVVGNGHEWIKVRLTENDNGILPRSMKARFSIAPPGQAYWAIEVRVDKDADTASPCSTSPNGTASGNYQWVEWGETGAFANSTDDSRNVVVEVRPRGLTCNVPWTLSIQGNVK